MAPRGARGYMRLITTLIGIATVAHAGASADSLAAARQRLRTAAQQAGVQWPLKHPQIRIEKRAHRLTLFAEGKVLRSYRVGLGADAISDKRREGDHLTPEGRFYVCSRNAASAYHLFLGVSYPDAAAADRGLREHLITAEQARAIKAAEARRALPPQLTRLGGLVGIHGGGSSSDWTWGCIALENAEIEELWVACALGTPIEILK
jgi:L,D-peptidoglycan transpeptidase YkuD (ErfK/YbiS/YcfS/YnhG family)